MRWQHEIAGWFAAVLLAVWFQLAPRPPGTPPGPPPPRYTVESVKAHLERTSAVDVTAQRGLQYALDFLSRAERAERAGQRFPADRYLEAAEGAIRVAEHQQHLQTNQPGIGRLPSPPAPQSPEDMQGRLQRTYFRIQQADFFARASGLPEVKRFPQWARDFYQLALRASDRKNSIAAEENRKSADDVVKILESLAQAASKPVQ